MPTGFPDYQAFEIPVSVPSGGTGAGSWTLNGVMYGRGTNTLGVTAAGAPYEPLRVPAAGGAPAFGALDLSQAATVTGILPVANGGWGTATGSFTSPGAIALIAGGADQGISLVPAGSAGLIIGAATGVGWVWVRGAAATERLLHFQTGVSNRWLIGAESTAETGTDAGSNFFLVRHSDAGARVETVIFIRRSDGQVGVGMITPTQRLDVDGSVRASAQLISAQATGTAPLVVVSTTEVANLNADRVGGTEVTNAAPALGALLIGTAAGTAAWSTAPLAVAYGGTGTATPALVAGTGITITGTWPNNTIALTIPVAVVNGGTGTITGSITGTTALTFTAGGADQDISLVPAGSAGLIIGAAAGVGWVWVRGAAATERLLHFQTGTSNRWLIGAGSTAETGTDAGSNLFVVRHSDAGARVATALFIRRSDGQVGINTITPTSQLHVSGDIRASGQVLWTPDGARVYHSAVSAIPNSTTTALGFDSERWDNGGLHSTTVNTGRLTAQRSGKYVISAHIAWEVNTTGDRHLSLEYNAISVLAVVGGATGSNGDCKQSISTIYHLAAGDYVRCMVWQNSGGALNVLAAGTYSPEFAIEWLGE